MLAFLDTLSPATILAGASLAVTVVNYLHCRNCKPGIDSEARAENAKLRKSLCGAYDEMDKQRDAILCLEAAVQAMGRKALPTPTTGWLKLDRWGRG